MSPTLRKLREALDLFTKLTANKTSAWRYSTEKVVKLFTVLDELAGDERYRKPLCPAFKPRLAELQENVAYYISMPVGDFAARKKALRKASDLAADIEKSLVIHEGLQPPERILLVALMQHFRNLFDHTVRCYCDAAQRYRKANDPERFWLYFCDPRSRSARAVATKKLEAEEQIERVRELIEDAPPRFREQRAKFEEYYVQWMSSDLDVDSLRDVLRKRWPLWFRFVYGLMTNFWFASLLILVPCGVAIVADYMGYHAWEGAGFFVITFGIIVAAMLSFTQVIHKLAKLWHSNMERKKPGYWFPCLMPRLARLTAVQMALIVEFDHSYEFPLGGSTWALLLLMITSFVTTRFFVTREMVDRKEQPGLVKITPPERRRVRQIVGLALAHSFLIAVVLSAIFAPSYERRHLTTEKAGQSAIGNINSTAVQHPTGATNPFWKVPVAMLNYLDATSTLHMRRRFLGLLPREVDFDLGKITEQHGYSLPPKVREIVSFRFYPTIILTWTALGLFFGVFLEGFMQGKRLRGEALREEDGV